MILLSTIDTTSWDVTNSSWGRPQFLRTFELIFEFRLVSSTYDNDVDLRRTGKLLCHPFLPNVVSYNRHPIGSQFAKNSVHPMTNMLCIRMRICYMFQLRSCPFGLDDTPKSEKMLHNTGVLVFSVYSNESTRKFSRLLCVSLAVG